MPLATNRRTPNAHTNSKQVRHDGHLQWSQGKKKGSSGPVPSGEGNGADESDPRKSRSRRAACHDVRRMRFRTAELQCDGGSRQAGWHTSVLYPMHAKVACDLGMA